MSVIPKVIYDQLNHDSLVPTSLHLQLVDQSIRRLVGITLDILVRIRNSFVHVDFVVLEMDVCHQILLILGRPFLSTTGATIDVTTRIIKLNISRKEETSKFKPKGTKKCNQVMVTIRPERNAMTPDKKPSATENFFTNFFTRQECHPDYDKISRRTGKLIFKGMKVVLLVDYKCEAGGKPVVIPFSFSCHFDV
jgi:hypothetical protein